MQTTSPLRLIDADVHNAIAKNADLLPYLPAYWAEIVGKHGLLIPGHAYFSPMGVFRHDTQTPGCERRAGNRLILAIRNPLFFFGGFSSP